MLCSIDVFSLLKLNANQIIYIKNLEIDIFQVRKTAFKEISLMKETY